MDMSHLFSAVEQDYYRDNWAANEKEQRVITAYVFQASSQSAVALIRTKRGTTSCHYALS
jgi:hypothetical protein